VRDDVITVLTNRAVAADKIDVEAAKDDLKRARTRRAATEFDQAERERTIQRARAQLQVAGHKLHVS
jgi:F0F1-type ATP synthase epsilon subunit